MSTSRPFLNFWRRGTRTSAPLPASAPSSTPGRTITVFRRAAGLLTPRFVALELLWSILVSLASFLWLRIPDSHAWQFALSLVLAVLIVALAVRYQRQLLYRLGHTAAPTPNPPSPTVKPQLRWSAVLALLCAPLLFLLLSTLLDHLALGADIRASFLNSRLPSSLRAHLLSYSRLVSLQLWFIALLRCLLGALLFAVATAPSIATPGAPRPPLTVLRRLPYWIAVIAALALGWAVSTILDWHPFLGHTTPELLSLALRLGVTAILSATLLCFVLAVIAVLLYRTSAGTPAVNHPRTVDAP